MQNFHDLVEEYKPLIYYTMKQLHIYRNKEAFYQTGLIALWEASKRYKPGRSTFATFAYHTIRGNMMNQLSQLNQHEDKYTTTSDDYLEMMQQVEDKLLEKEVLMSYCAGLTPMQNQWVQMTFLYGYATKDIAKKNGVSVSAVKKWKAGAMEKIKRNIQKNY